MDVAKCENEWYRPYNEVRCKLSAARTDERLPGLWAFIGPSIVYAPINSTNEAIACGIYNRIFLDDPIAYGLLYRLIKRAANAKKIVLHRSDANIQSVIDEAQNPELILAPRSSFAAVLADADYGADLWVWCL